MKRPKDHNSIDRKPVCSRQLDMHRQPPPHSLADHAASFMSGIDSTRLQLLETAVEGSTSGITIADASKPDMPLVYANPSFYEMTGYLPEDVIGRNCRFLQKDDRDQASIDVLRKTIKAGQSCRIELRNYHKDGTLFWNELLLYPLHDEQGNLTHYVGVQNDITEQKLAREALLEAKRTQTEIAQEREMIALRERVMATVSHDFRTPFSVINLYAGLIEENFESLSPQQIARYTTNIRTNIDHMTALLDDVMSYSRGQAVNLEFHGSHVNLRALCLELIDHAKATAKSARHFHFQFLCPQDGYECDERLLRQALGNLLTNAIKYSPADSTIEFTVAHQNQSLEFKIQDQGIGVPVNDQPFLFEPFFRAANVEKIKGTGLGLSIVKQSVEAHNGSITCTSEPGHGTLFTIKIPYLE